MTTVSASAFAEADDASEAPRRPNPLLEQSAASDSNLAPLAAGNRPDPTRLDEVPQDGWGDDREGGAKRQGRREPLEVEGVGDEDPGADEPQHDRERRLQIAEAMDLSASAQ